MSANASFFSRHLFRIHSATWIAVLALGFVEGYFLDLRTPFSVPLTVYIVLVALPFIIVPSFRASALDISSPAALRRFLCSSRWCLAALWTFALFILIMCMVGDARVKSILKGTNHAPNKTLQSARRSALPSSLCYTAPGGSSGSCGFCIAAPRRWV